MNRLHIAVLRGGPNAEYELSLATGASVLAVLGAAGATTRDVVITKSGEWLLDGFSSTPQRALLGVDVVFIALHGGYGGQGSLQRLLERLDIPYTGSGPLASALALNKVLAKEHLRSAGVKMPRHMRVAKEAQADVAQVAHNIQELFGPEYFIKPVNGGSSIDVAIANNTTELAAVLQRLLQTHSGVIVEERIAGREATVGILENFRSQRHYLLPVVEIYPEDTGAHFTTQQKQQGAARQVCPGRFSSRQRDELFAAAATVHQHLNLRHYSRADFIINDSGVYFLEVNTNPDLRAESLLAKAAQSIGSSHEELITHLISLAK